MKNHPVNNDYVQNLIEGLSEAVQPYNPNNVRLPKKGDMEKIRDMEATRKAERERLDRNRAGEGEGIQAGVHKRMEKHSPGSTDNLQTDSVDLVRTLNLKVVNETRKGAPGSVKRKLQDADSENRREATQDAINTQAAEDGGSGVASDIEHGRWEPDIKDEGGSARTGKKKPGNKPKRGYKRKDGSKVTYPRTNTAGRRVEKNEKFDKEDHPGHFS